MFKEKIKQMELVSFEALGTVDIVLEIAWSKIFLANTLQKENKIKEAEQVIRDTIEEIVKSLDGEEQHPHLESYYE
jgi:hypothetical protein